MEKMEGKYSNYWTLWAETNELDQFSGRILFLSGDLVEGLGMKEFIF